MPMLGLSNRNAPKLEIRCQMRGNTLREHSRLEAADTLIRAMPGVQGPVMVFGHRFCSPGLYD